MTDKSDYQRPEGALIARAAAMKGMSARQAAKEASLSDARWRQIVSGYASVGAGQVVGVEGPAETIARMAYVVGVTAEQLREAGRPDAADMLLTVSGMQAESEWQAVGTALDRLLGIREQLDAVIEELSAAPVVPGGRGARGAGPQVDVGEPELGAGNGA